MLTPLFQFSQTADNLTLKVHVPLADIANAEVLVEDGNLLFTAPPYFLR